MRQVAALLVQRGDVAAEAKALLKIGSHPRLVKFLGQSMESNGQAILLVEYAPLGDLRTRLSEPMGELAPLEETLQSSHRKAILQQICSGMEALAAHKPQPLVHRDLALRNILLFSYNPSDVTATSVKVSDFGLTVNAYSAQYTSQAPRAYGAEGEARPLRWLAPEALSRCRYSEASDVWAFGVTAYELLSNGGMPYYQISNNESVIAHVMAGNHPELSHDALSDDDLALWDVLLQCFKTSANERPKFSGLGILLGQRIKPKPRPRPKPKPAASSTPRSSEIPRRSTFVNMGRSVNSTGSSVRRSAGSSHDERRPLLGHRNLSISQRDCPPCWRPDAWGWLFILALPCMGGGACVTVYNTLK